MEAKETLVEDGAMTAPTPVYEPILGKEDGFACTTCSYPIEILKINDEDNNITFKCLNPKEKEEKTVKISEYLDSMRKFTYLYSECSLCNKKQNELENITIFSYCIKCDVIICSNCINKHLEINEENHNGLNDKEYIIKNNEKSIKCLLHPIEKNIAFCLKCKTHICKECIKNYKHINHTKINLIEVLVTDEI